MRKNHKGMGSSFLPAISVIALLLVACPPVDKGITYKHSPTTRAKLLEAIEAEIKAQKTPSPNLNNIDTSKITDMSALFQGKDKFNGDISKWNVSKVSTMANMFNGAAAFKQNLDAWKVNPDTVDVTDMFTGSGISDAKIPTWLVTLTTNVTKLTTGSGADITPVTFTISPTNVTGTFAISPTLPGDLIFTGKTSPATLQGTPTKAAAATDYTITFTGTGIYKRYKASKTFSIEIITYKHTPADKAALETAIAAETAKGNAANYNSIDTRRVRDMSGLFQGNTDFNGDISRWVVSQVSTMANMFKGATKFNQDLQVWNVNPDTVDITDMFTGSGVADNNIPGWYLKITPSPTSLGLEKNVAIAPAKSITFTTRPADIAGSFSITPTIPGLNIDSSTRKITGTPAATSDSTSYTVTFTADGANKRTATATVQIEVAVVLTPKQKLQAAIMAETAKGDAADYNSSAIRQLVAQVSDMSGLFQDNETFNGDISGWNVAHVTDMSNMFNGATSFNQDLEGWNVTPATVNVTDMFTDSGVTAANIPDWYPKITPSQPKLYGLKDARFTEVSFTISPAGLTGTFSISPNLPSNLSLDTTNGGISGTPDVFYERTTHTITFRDPAGSPNYTTTAKLDIGVYEFKPTGADADAIRRSLGSIVDKEIATNGNDANLNNIDTSDVTKMNAIFSDKADFNGNISKWDVSKVTDMNYMFNNASKFNGDISKWDVSQVTTMELMFYYAKEFNGNISKWDVSKVTEMRAMFNGAAKFNGNISNWDVSRVKNMNHMFQGAKAFNQNISGWEVVSVNDMSNMFRDAVVFNQDLTDWGEHVRNRKVKKLDIFERSPLADKEPEWAKVITWNGR